MVLTRRHFGQWAAGTAALGMAGRASAAPYDQAVAIGITPTQLARIRVLAESFLVNYRAPGLSVAYAEAGTITYAASFGLADATVGEPLTAAHNFRIASISKPITAAAIMRLVQAKQLTLRTRVFGPDGVLNTRIPLPASVPQRRWLESITVDHLLTHTCGGWVNDALDPMFQAPSLGHDELIAMTLQQAPLVTQPGTVYAYSNFGYCLLGRIIEVISGDTYERHVRSRILRPAGAQAMRLGGNKLAQRRPGEVVYSSTEGAGAYAYNITRMDSHGGWIGTATDLVNIGLRIDGLSTPPDVLTPYSVTRMRTPTAATPWYGRGWTVSPQHTNRWHTGSLPGTTTILALLGNGAVFAGLVNARSWSPNSGVGLDNLMWNIYAQVAA